MATIPKAPAAAPSEGLPAPHPYAGQTVHFVTQHHKGKFVAEAFRDIGVQVKELTIDTDQFGTFSGEVERTGTVLEALQKKIKAGQQAEPGHRLYLASEGSFLAHPFLPTASVNEESLLLVDTQEQRVFSVTLTSSQTNTAQIVTSDSTVVSEFLEVIGFPEAGVILRPYENEKSPKTKGPAMKDLATREDVLREFSRIACNQKVEILSDHRAHRNPLRQQVIRDTAKLLVKRLKSLCPQCGAFGFWGQGVERGLPCEVCETPTELIREVVFGCDPCGHSEARPREDGRTHADSSNCPECNP